MAAVMKTSAGKAGKKKKKKKGKDSSGINVSLPMKPSVPVADLSAYSVLIHGEKKIGKTTLTTVEGDVFLLTFDPPQRAYAVKQRHCPDWKHFIAYLDLLEQKARDDDYPYKRVVVDGADIWYRRCQDYICKKLVIDHPSEEKWGKGWDLLKSTFAKAVDRLLALPGGCWFISHSEWQEVETRRGDKVQKLNPLIKAGGQDILVGRVDAWFAYDYVGEERVLVVRGDEVTGAGHRIKGHFETPAGKAVREIPMGETEEEAWANFLKAFNNEQEFVSVKQRDRLAEGGSDKKKAKKKAA